MDPEEIASKRVQAIYKATKDAAERGCGWVRFLPNGDVEYTHPDNVRFIELEHTSLDDTQPVENNGG